MIHGENVTGKLSLTSFNIREEDILWRLWSLFSSLKSPQRQVHPKIACLFRFPVIRNFRYYRNLLFLIEPKDL